MVRSFGEINENLNLVILEFSVCDSKIDKTEVFIYLKDVYRLKTFLCMIMVRNRLF